MLTAVPTSVTRMDTMRLRYTISVEKMYRYASKENVVGNKINFFVMTSSTVAKEAAMTWMNGSTHINANMSRKE